MIKAEIIDVFGNKIVLTEERWNHIVFRHPKMAKNYEKLEKTLAEPSVIVESRLNKSVRLYHRRFSALKGYVVVVVNITRKFVITAYIALKVKQGNIVWQKK
jgi:hypothetical protein